MVQLLPDAVREHRKQVVRTRWAEGASAGQIAKELGVTRNIVSSIIHRLSLPKRSEDAKVQQGCANAAKQKAKPKGFALPVIAGLGLSVAKDKKPPHKASKEILKPLGLFADFPADRTTCRAISGDVSTGHWQCCGREGYPYCPGHAERFLTKPTGKSTIDPAIVRKSGINRALG